MVWRSSSGTIADFRPEIRVFPPGPIFYRDLVTLWFADSIIWMHPVDG
jgi:hypothetical protein